MGSIGASTATGGIKVPGQVHSRKEAGKAATNNVIRVMNFLGSKRPTFVDPVARGYRVYYGDAEESELKAFSDRIKAGTGIEIEYRKRSGYGPKTGGWDLIIPYSTDDEKLTYNRR